MSMMIALAFLVLGTIALVTPTVVAAYRRFRGPRVVMCPATATPEVVQFGALRAAITLPFMQPSLSVRACSRWSGRQSCPQDCLTYVHPTAAEEHGLLIRPLRRY